MCGEEIIFWLGNGRFMVCVWFVCGVCVCEMTHVGGERALHGGLMGARCEVRGRAASCGELLAAR